MLKPTDQLIPLPINIKNDSKEIPQTRHLDEAVGTVSAAQFSHLQSNQPVDLSSKLNATSVNTGESIEAAFSWINGDTTENSSDEEYEFNENDFSTPRGSVGVVLESEENESDPFEGINLQQLQQDLAPFVDSSSEEQDVKSPSPLVSTDSASVVRLPTMPSKITSVDIQTIQTHFSQANDDTAIPPQKRLVEMMNKLSADLAAEIDPNSYQIHFVLDGAPDQHLAESFEVEAESFYKIKFTATIQFTDQNGYNISADGQPLAIELKREIYSSFKNPQKLVDCAEIFAQGFIDIALRSAVANAQPQLLKFADDGERLAALEQNSFRFNSEYDSSGELQAIKKMSAVDPVSKQKIELNFNDAYLSKKQVKAHSNYAVHHSDLPSFVNSAELSTYLVSIKKRLNGSKNTFYTLKNDCEETYQGWKLWKRGQVKESNEFRELLADLNLDEKVVLQADEFVLPQDISAAKRDYLTKKQKYLTLKKQLETIGTLAEKLASEVILDEKDTKLIASIRQKLPKLAASKPIDLDLVQATLTLVTERVATQKAECKAIMLKMDKENQLLNRIHAFKTVITELKAHRDELERLVNSKPNNATQQKIDATLSDLRAEIDTYETWAKNISAKIESAKKS